jgi:hypothetical protein
MSPSSTSSENDLLVDRLGSQRAHVVGILEGLSEEEIRRPVLPSGWSGLGLLQHLAVDVEQLWFRGVVGGNRAAIDEVVRYDAWHVGPGTPVASVFDLYRRQAAAADAIIGAASLDAPPGVWPDDLFGEWRLDSVREVVLHVLTETATHAGHLDAARELIDGRTWLILG